jgi:hypothetical protein
MNSYGRYLPLAGIFSLIMLVSWTGERSVNGAETAVPAAMQEATAQLKMFPSSAISSWPNDGVLPLLTYGWGGDRPLPPIMALDSSIIPQVGSQRPPILIVQRRSDNFSPILQSMSEQEQAVRAMTITIAPFVGETVSYTMWNVRVVGIRDVGRVIEENPVTQEIVFVFERLTLGSFDEGDVFNSEF